MQEPSIRSFTLEYYRSLGAQLTPLDAEKRQWEIRLPEFRQQDARTLNVAFDPQAGPEGGALMARSSAPWREMLERFLQERPVSHRHLVTQPIDQVADHLRAMLPGFGIRRAQLTSVKPRLALGFTHRVTYDAPALAGRVEELHHDLLEAQTGDRLDGLSESFYSLPSIPLAPPQDPQMLPVEHLRARVASRLDQLSDERGHDLEHELRERLEATSEQLAQYYHDRIRQLRQDEVSALEAHLEQLARRMEATKLDGAIASLRKEAGQVVLQIEQLEVARELEAEPLRAERDARLEAERERHELTIETTLVSLAYVTFDEVSYALNMGDGGLLEVTYVPVTGSLAMPACPACGLAFAVGSDAPHPGHQGARIVCHRCAPEPAAEGSLELAVPREAEPCARCGVMTPLEAIQRCHLSEAAYCVVCALRCQECGAVTARNLMRPNPAGRGMICQDHAIACATCQGAVLPQETFSCPACSHRHCASHAQACPACGMPSCASCARKGPCKACGALAPVRRDHDLIKVLRGLYPGLDGWSLRWRWARVGDLALLEWSAPWGEAGRYVLAIDDYYVLATRKRRPLGGWR